MSAILGSGSYTYQVEEAGWGNVPKGWEFGDVGGVAVDASDNVFVFNRGSHPMVVFDSGGDVVTSWGEGIFVRPHGVHIGPDGLIYCTDEDSFTAPTTETTRCGYARLRGRSYVRSEVPVIRLRS